jgi:hypothetical protein
VKIQDMNTKTKALTLLSVIVIAAVAGSIVLAVQSMVKADPTASVASNSEIASSSVNATDSGPRDLNGFGGGPMMMGEGPRGGMGGPRGLERCGGFGPEAYQVSADFTANVTNIAQSDSDVQTLLTQGFNITSIHPVVTTTIDGNGNVVTKASTADVFLQGNNGSRSFVVVDLAQAKVTKIVTLNVTEIDK